MEDVAFMRHAIGSDGHGGIVPIFNQHFSGMRQLVSELYESKIVQGGRVKALLRFRIPRGS